MHDEHDEATKQQARPSPSAHDESASRSERLLGEIAEHVRVWSRQRSMEDFTLVKLAGVVTEIAAVGLALGAFMAMASPRPDVYASHRWLGAIFLQLLAMTFFQLHRQR